MYIVKKDNIRSPLNQYNTGISPGYSEELDSVSFGALFSSALRTHEKPDNLCITLQLCEWGEERNPLQVVHLALPHLTNHLNLGARCSLLIRTAQKNHQAVTAYLKSKQVLYFCLFAQCQCRCIDVVILCIIYLM